MPFGQAELDRYLFEHKITGPANDYIRGAAAGLSRDVRPSGFASKCVEYQSHKMGVTVSTESDTGEYVFARKLEYDTKVLGYYEQPPKVELHRQTKRGYKRLTSYHPDFLVLRIDGPIVVQVKKANELVDLVASSPDWAQEVDGSYRDLPAEEKFAELPLRHIVAAIGPADQQSAANITLLLRSVRTMMDVEDVERRAAAHLDKHGILSLAELADALGLQDYTPLIRLIANNTLCTDIERYSLAHPTTCCVVLDPQLLSSDVAGAWAELRLSKPGSGELCAPQSALPLAKHLAKGIEAVNALARGRNDRTARRWKAKIRQAAAEGVSPIIAMSRDYSRRGNRNAKRQEAIELATQHIKQMWGSGLSPRALYRLHRNAEECERLGIPPVSRPTYYKLIASLAGRLAYERGGNRAKNAAQAPAPIEDRALRAERPFELATCDHYLCDIHVVVIGANNVSYTMQPWLTVLRDVATTSVLAFWLQLRAPSRRSVALVIRQCVRNHGRLPERTVVDSGSDFRSNYFSALAAHCSMDLMSRPVGHPRYGSEAERYFGQFKDLWLSARAGNRVDIREVRSVSGSHRPEKRACITLLDLWDDLLTFNAWLDVYTTDSALASPATRMREGLTRFSCSGIETAYDDRFIIASAVDEAQYTFDPTRGLHIGAFHYWHPDLSRVTCRKVPVRIDPQNPYQIYALALDRWITCQASPAPSYSKKSALEQIVEGAVLLAGPDLRNAVRTDADRGLVQAITTRSKASSIPLPPAAINTDLPTQLAEGKDIFDEIACDELPRLQEASWA